MVIDVNGWSFVKGNQASIHVMKNCADVQAYYDKAAEIMSSVCNIARQKKALAKPIGSSTLNPTESQSAASSYSTLRATVTGQLERCYFLLRG